MTDRTGPTNLAERGADRIAHAFTVYENAFQEITSRVRERFEQREWHDIQSDAQERLDLYTRVLDGLEVEIRRLLAGEIDNQALWKRIRNAFGSRTSSDPNVELAETFFNSITRRVFSTVGVNPEIEYASTESALHHASSSTRIYHRHAGRPDLLELVRAVLEDYPFRVGYRNLEDDARRVAAELARRLDSGTIDAVECLKPLFFRNKGAYIVGRLRAGVDVVPFVLPLLNSDDGIIVDALLTNQNEVSIVFSFTRSYFLVDTDCPRELIVFLKSIMPLKPIAELYTALGFNKHGKTEMYRSLMRHLAKYDDRFVIAPGDRGMVMGVFTLPGFDVVFKVIQDEFAPPKHSTRRHVMERYRLVFQHDRVGRLIDAHEFEHLEFARQRFSEDLLEELLTVAGRTVEQHGDRVVIHHLYAERKVTPLNLYLRRTDDEAARLAVIDYGDAIKELAAANIFPGDFLLKNFGVTRHGRVVFYDYDELCLLDDCRFRRLPPSRNPEDDLAAEPWFSVGENDIFPEEFHRFLGLSPALRATYEQHHSDLSDVEFWTRLQQRHERGELLDVFPYSESRRLHGTGSTSIDLQ